MALIRFLDKPFYRNPWSQLERMRQEMDRLNRNSNNDFATYPSSSAYPAMNITEDANNVYVRAEIPGLPANEPELFVEGDTLTIKGERKPGAVDEKGSYHRREIEYGRFSRAITLPTQINTEKVKAASKNGILTVTLPKAEEVKPKKIAVEIK